jgi:HD-like signal output (HDOD) protein
MSMEYPGTLDLTDFEGTLDEAEAELREFSRQSELERRMERLAADFQPHLDGDVGAVLEALSTDHLLDSGIKRPPDSLLNVLHKARDANTSSRELTHLIEQDPVLSHAVLRYANSAAFGTIRKGLSVGGAIQRVGLRSVNAIVMGEFVRSEYLRPGPGLDEIARLVWDHMVRTGPVARIIARRLQLNADDALTLGLLHDVGKLVILDAVSRLRSELRRDLVFPDGFIHRALAELHEPLGGVAIVSWGLDSVAGGIIAAHHRSGHSVVPEPMTEVVYLAERLDLARTRGQVLDQVEVWSQGRLTIPSPEFRDLFEVLEDGVED